MAAPVSYDQWRTDALNILSNYGMDQFVQGYSADLINFAMRKNIEKVRAASTFEICISLANEAIGAAVGFRMDVTTFISNKQHQDSLFMLFSAWRSKILNEEEEAAKQQQV